jgi:soluble lytic murein transglycosylase
MLKKLQKKQISLIAGAGICAFLAGAMVSAPEIGKNIGQLLKQGQESEKLSEANNAKSEVLPLVLKSPEEREAKLRQIAEKGPPQDRRRARYLLASDLIERKEGKEALKYLEKLEDDYQLIKPYVLLKRAHAYEILKEEGKASDLRQKVVKEYGKTAAAPKALYLIGLKEYQDKAITDFPSHPLTWEIIKQRLQENPDQTSLQLTLARYAFDQPGTTSVIDRLVAQAQNPMQADGETSLKAEDWEAIGAAYWRTEQFAKAASAYSKAPPSARNFYREARGLQIGGDREKAVTVYKATVKEFPEAKESGTALLRLAEMAKESQDSISYLDQAISKFPDSAGKALVQKAKILEGKDKKSADAAKQELIDKFGNTEEASEYRWKVAQQKAKAKDYKAAWQWAEPIATNTPNSILAPRAGFWVGKWASKLGKQEEAKKAYQYVVSQFPYSYYAWRSATILGLNVGSFDTVRQMTPEIVELQRPLPPAGSDTFKELYLLGQDRDAWLQWQTEFINKLQPTVSEEFTDGLLILAKGEYLQAIEKISRLEDRESPEDKAEYENLSKQISYWQARYPRPFMDKIQKWSTERKLNPLLVIALMRQESRFQTKIKSPVGATGLMQVMPATAKWIAPQIKVDKYDLENPNDNIMMGTWFLDSTHQQYKGNSMLAIASYNAGPGNVSKWLGKISDSDPDEFVEEIPFEETQGYVRQVFGNYWNYLRLYNPEISRLVAQYSAEHPQLPHQE